MKIFCSNTAKGKKYIIAQTKIFLTYFVNSCQIPKCFISVQENLSFKVHGQYLFSLIRKYVSRLTEEPLGFVRSPWHRVHGPTVLSLLCIQNAFCIVHGCFFCIIVLQVQQLQQYRLQNQDNVSSCPCLCPNNDLSQRSETLQVLCQIMCVP